MKYLLIILILFTSCKLSKEQRRINKKSKKIEKIAREEGLFTTDTAKATVQYITEVTKIDTVFQLTQDTIYLDSLSIVKIFPPKHFKYEKEGVKVWLDRLDNLDYFSYNLQVEVVPDTIIQEVKIPFETIQPKEIIKVPIELSKWRTAMLKLGNGVFWLFVAAIVFLIVRFVIKTYTRI